jgi:transposase
MSMDASSLPNDLAVLKELVVKQDATIDQQVSTIDSLTSKLAQLEHYVAQLVRARFGPRSEKLDPTQMALFEAAVDEAAKSVAPVVETQVETHVRRGGGRSELPADLPRERIEHDLSEQEKCCPGCGQVRQRIGSETSEQLD